MADNFDAARCGAWRIAHSLLPLAHRLRRALQSRHADRRAWRSRRSLRAARRAYRRSGRRRGRHPCQGLEPRPRGGDRQRAGADHARHHHDAGLRHEPRPARSGIAAKIATGQIELGISLGSDTTSDAPVVFQRRFAQRLVQLSRARSLGQKAAAFKGFTPGRAGAAAAFDLRAAHRPQHGRALRADGQGMGHHPRGTGSVGL